MEHNKFETEAIKCEHCGHDGAVKQVMDSLPDIDSLYDLAELFKVFGDSTRIRILCVLFEGEMCVCGIAEALNMTVSAISHQLRILKSARLVKYRKDGKTSYYSLDDDHVKEILEAGLEHIMHKRGVN